MQLSNSCSPPLIQLNNGYKIPLVGFGTYKIRGQEKVDKCIAMALECGYRLFDTAKSYFNEAELGNAFEKLLPKYNLKREDIFITTKLWPSSDNNTEVVPKLIQESLENLKTSYLDLVLIHYPKPDGRENDDPENYNCRKDCWLALEKFSESIIHSIGVSSFESRHIEELAKYSKKIPAANQVEFTPHFLRTELQNYCKEKGIYFNAFSSHGRQHPDLIGDPIINQVAKKHHTTVQTILLSFATSQNIGVIPKSENPQRIRDNFKCFELKLDQEDLNQLNSIDKNHNYIRTTGWLVK